MKYTRFKSGSNINWGEIIGDEVIELSDNYINPGSSKTNTSHSLSDVELISPVTPGKVVAIGSGARTEDGKTIPMDVKVGDIVLFGKWSGTEVKIDGKEYSIMKEADIMGISKGKK